ncbi:hypothetical protein GL177_18780 [Vibrio toranzoniae]|uniref:polysaccharide pyruvyl transferase family protein n=1 Tax=Vibrio toranzoniae TaxID=1194427 RepID=UPI001377BAB9|nr:polysaccharide pyruvyl transferase family protein [Vibrio toranzoniae]NAZ55358.1 hypothetical protein [Vibrio toranzoniae]
MKKYIIVSTYPESGSKNIGDQLITSALIDAIKFVKGSKVIIDVVYRAESWEKIENKFESADAIIFACLAIRPNMSVVEYPYLSKLLTLNIPLAVISSGTSLPVTPWRGSVYNYVSDDTKEQLLALDKKAFLFTTRGYLTQQFCEEIGMTNTMFSGDIAFFDCMNEVKSFKRNKDINKIIISDPHYAKEFLESFDTLVKRVMDSFPQAQVIIALHGDDPLIKGYANDNDIDYQEIYKNKDDGLKIYDDADLHIGYRVHAHVSSLKRGVYSYLLEQDGRGCDYGLTINRKISIPSYRNPKSKIDSLLLRLGCNKKTVSTSPAEQMIALVNQDKLFGFEKFIGLERQIETFSDLLLSSLKKLP